jgi:MerR family transcriptional regulator/heat shock protein HspR
MAIEHDRAAGVYGISVAAELTGVGPQTLRLYEAKGLLDPVRTDGGTRRYSRQDLDRVEEITSLTAEGLSLGGIKRILEMQIHVEALREEVEQLRRQLEAKQKRRGG